jgi:hypothetical protein
MERDMQGSSGGSGTRLEVQKSVSNKEKETKDGALGHSNIRERKRGCQGS